MLGPSSSTQLPIPGTPAYKKARKAYLKSTQNRASDDSHDWSPFRKAEKKFKAKFPPPDLSKVLDLALLDERRQKEVEGGIWKGSSDALKVTRIQLKQPTSVRGEPTRSTSRAYILDQVPGMSTIASRILKVLKQ